MGCCGGGHQNHKMNHTNDNTMESSGFTRLALLLILMLVVFGGVGFYFLK